MNALVKVTGPHAGAVKVEGEARAAWRVAVIEAETMKPKSKVYVCLSYSRAVSLSCHMAHDRKLHLHVAALPR
jgi:hypothetical protein